MRTVHPHGNPRTGVRPSQQLSRSLDDGAIPPVPDAARHYSGMLLVLVSALVFSSAGLFVRGVAADAWDILFWRGLSAAAIASVLIVWRGRTAREFASMGGSGLAVAITGAAATAAFIPAFKLTSIANVTLIYAAVPFASAAIAWLWLREKPSRRVLTASLLAFAGVLLIVFGSFSGISLKGDLLALGMTVGMAAMLCIYRRFPRTPAAGPMVLSCLLLVPLAWLAGDPLQASLRDIGVIALFGVVFSVASITLAEGARRLPAAETALISSLETPLAPVWAYLVFTEIPACSTAFGGLIILLAVFGSQWPSGEPSGRSSDSAANHETR